MFHFVGRFTDEEIMRIESETRKNVAIMGSPSSYEEWKALIEKASMELNIEITPIEISQIIRT